MDADAIEGRGLLPAVLNRSVVGRQRNPPGVPLGRGLEVTFIISTRG